MTTVSLVTLAQLYRGDVITQINRQTSLLKHVKITSGEGKNVAWAPEGDGAVAENYSEGADASNFGGDAQTSAILSWALYRSNFHVSNLALDSAASSVDPLGNRALWARNLMNNAGKLGSFINGKMFSGVGTGTEMCGLAEAIGKDDNTYATIDRTDANFAYWKPTIIDPGVLTAPTLALLRDDLRKVYEACGENPDVAVATPAVFNTIGNLFDATRRYVDYVNSARGMQKLSFGFQAIEVDGCVFIRDKDCTANRIYYLNTASMEVQYLPSASQRMVLDAAAVEVVGDDGFGEVPLGFKYEMLAKTGPSEKAEILFQGQLKIERPNRFATRKNVAVS